MAGGRPPSYTPRDYVCDLIDAICRGNLDPTDAEFAKKWGVAESTVQWNREKATKFGWIVRMKGGRFGHKISIPGLKLSVEALPDLVLPECTNGGKEDQ